jgi:hypothetical protein
MKPVADNRYWPCIPNGLVRVYLSEMPDFTMVGVCDMDDYYIRREFAVYEEARPYFDRIAAMAVIDRQSLFDMGFKVD